MKTRREILKMGLMSLAASVVLPSALALAENRRRADKAGATSDLVDEKSQTAIGVKYHSNISNVKDKSVMIERQGVAFKNQKCSACILYQGQAGEKNGPCMVFPGKKVAAEGWCTSWNKKS